MGTDISIVIEFKPSEKAPWQVFGLQRGPDGEPVESEDPGLQVDRSYSLFQAMAGVRAVEGCKPAIYQPRGIPIDCHELTRAWAEQLILPSYLTLDDTLLYRARLGGLEWPIYTMENLRKQYGMIPETYLRVVFGFTSV